MPAVTRLPGSSEATQAATLSPAQSWGSQASFPIRASQAGVHASPSALRPTCAVKKEPAHNHTASLPPTSCLHRAQVATEVGTLAGNSLRACRRPGQGGPWLGLSHSCRGMGKPFGKPSVLGSAWCRAPPGAQTTVGVRGGGALHPVVWCFILFSPIPPEGHAS